MVDASDHSARQLSDSGENKVEAEQAFDDAVDDAVDDVDEQLSAKFGAVAGSDKTVETSTLPAKFQSAGEPSITVRPLVARARTLYDRDKQQLWGALRNNSRKKEPSCFEAGDYYIEHSEVPELVLMRDGALSSAAAAAAVAAVAAAAGGGDPLSGPGLFCRTSASTGAGSPTCASTPRTRRCRPSRKSGTLWRAT